MTTEILAAAVQLMAEPLHEQIHEQRQELRVMEMQVSNLMEHNAELHYRNERLRQERDDLRRLLVKMRKRVAEVMDYPLDDFN